jgi:hypothetical protein
MMITDMVTITVERELLSRFLQGEDDQAHTDFWNALVEQSGAMDEYCKRAEVDDVRNL